MKFHVAIAQAPEEIHACQGLIAEVYQRQYGVVLSAGTPDPEAKIDPWPDRYLMVWDRHGLAGTMGLYLEHTYVERFGQVERADLERVLAAAGAADRYDPMRVREIAKLVARPEYRGMHLGRFTLSFALSRSFSQMGAAAPQLLVFCAKQSIISSLMVPIGLGTRPIKPFPVYKVHERYRSATDAMSSNLIIPDLDIPRRLYELELPGEYDVADVVQRGHDARAVTPS